MLEKLTFKSKKGVSNAKILASSSISLTNPLLDFKTYRVDLTTHPARGMLENFSVRYSHANYSIKERKCG